MVAESSYLLWRRVPWRVAAALSALPVGGVWLIGSVPIREYEVSEEEDPPGSGTFIVTSRGLVDTAEEEGVPYIVRWADGDWDPHFLVCFEVEKVAISCFFDSEAGGFRVLEPIAYDWVGLEQSHRILSREEAVGSAIATAAYRVLDEIWLHDPELGLHLGCNSVAMDQAEIPSDEEVGRQAMEAGSEDDERYRYRETKSFRWL